MGYHVTVRRPDGEGIPREAVRVWLSTQAELEVVRETRATLQFAAVGAPEGPLLVWQDGEVWCDGPDQDALARLGALAQALGARVTGDEGERYDPDGTMRSPAPAQERREAERRATAAERRGRNRRQWALNGAIALGFLLLALLAQWCSGG